MRKIRLALSIILFLLTPFWLISQRAGCPDIKAKNYDASAVSNDGSCKYGSTSANPLTLIDKLSDTLNEISGMLNIHGDLWGLGDSGNPNRIYRFDKSTGHILQSLMIRNAKNIDWEEMTSDGRYIYIGDFGNNNGNRRELCIYMFPVSLISNNGTDTIDAEKINFRYADQADFSAKPKSTRYDCEAMIVMNDSIHLFSKDWAGEYTRHYKLPARPGSYTLSPEDSIYAGCLITGACYDALSSRIVLTGYQKTGACFLWLLWDFKNQEVFSGNKRKINLGFFTNTGQIESVCFNDSDNIYITNEKNIVPNRLFGLNTGQWMNVSEGYLKESKVDSVDLIPEAATGEIRLKYILQKPGIISYCIYSAKGNLAGCYKIPENGGPVDERINIAPFAPGPYFIIVHNGMVSSAKKYFMKN
jgi:hypothetical protein